MARASIYKIYLATRPDGIRYVGCTKETPEKRIRCRYHPIRRDRGAWNAIPVSDISLTILAWTTSISAASRLETQMILDHDACGPLGANGTAKSNYPKATRLPNKRRPNQDRP